MADHRSNRRSFVMIAVLVVVGSALLIATSLLFLSQERVADASVATDTAQARALAWSGLRVLMSQFDDQRQRILQGEMPRLDSQYTIYETHTRQGIVRLLPARGGSATDQPYSCESGKISLNRADAESLVRTGLVDAAAAAAVISYRDQTLGRPFQSVAELLNAPGADITPEKLYGPVNAITPRNDAQVNGIDTGQRILNRLNASAIQGLADVVTVFGVDPSIQLSGKRRINLNVPWSDDLSAQVADRFGERAAEMLKGAFDRGMKFDSPAKLIQALIQAKIPADDWPQIIDSFTTDADVYHAGLLDINTAPQEALLSLPGVTADQAAQMIRVRQELSAQELATAAWPVISQIITPEAFAALAGRITARCWAYRVRLATGEVDASDPDSDLKHPLIYEAVIDLSAPKARIAYLRDITVLQETAMLAAEAAAKQSTQFAESGDESENDSPSKTELAAASAPDSLSKNSATSKPASAPPVTRSTDHSKPPAPAANQSPAAPPASMPTSTSSGRIGRWVPG